MLSTRTQLLVLAVTLAVAAAALFLPVPDLETDHRLSVFVSRGMETLATDLAVDAVGGNPRRVSVAAGSSRALLAHLSPGAVPDAIITTDRALLDALVERDQLDPQEIVTLFEASLVLVIPAHDERPLHPAEYLLNPALRTVAVGAADTALGRTTRSTLSTLGIWFNLLPRLKPCGSAAAAINHVRQGRADAAIVFAPDVDTAESVQIVSDAFPPGSHTPVPHLAARPRRAAHPEASQRFLAYLRSEKARQRIQSYLAGRRLLFPVDWWSRVWIPLLLSLRASCLALMMVMPLAVAVAAFLARRRKSLLERVVDALVTVPLVVPPVAVGLMLLVLFAEDGWIARHLDLPLAFTWQAGALAAAIVSFPLAVRPMQRSFSSVDGRYRKAAESLGAGPFGYFLLVVLPLSGRGLLVGSMLCFARAFGEFGATLLVAGNVPALTRTLPLALFTEIETGVDGLVPVLFWLAVGLALVSSLAAAIWAPGRGDVT